MAKITVIIADDTRKRECDISCGEDWSSTDTITLARWQIKERFGTGIKLEYRDLGRTSDERQVLEWNKKIKEENLSVPLLLINNNLRISGQFDIRQLMNAIETEIEIGVLS